jgi:site-specific DNA recombinase
MRSLNLIHIYTEPGVSGYKGTRPALDKLMLAAARKEFDAIVFYHFSRFARNTSDLLDKFKKLQQLDIALVSTEQEINTSGHYGKAMLGILSIIDELERDVIKERTDDGRNSKLRDGRAFWGHAPYGYKFNKETCKLEQDPLEASTYKHIVKRYYTDHLSMADLAVEMNEQHISCRRETTLWSAPTLSGILRNPIYYSRKYTTDRTPPTTYDIEPIISKAKWDSMQKYISKARKRSGKPGEAANHFLLYRQLECALCGATLSSRYRPIQDGRRRVYCCYWHRANEKKMDGHERCSLPYFNAIDIEESVIEALKFLLLGKREDVFDNSSKRQAEKLTELTTDLKNCMKAKKKKETASKGLPKALEAGLDPVKFASLDIKYTNEISDLDIRIDEIHTELDSLRLQKDEEQFFYKFRADQHVHLSLLAMKVDTLSFEKKQRLIKGMLSDLIIVHADGRL